MSDYWKANFDFENPYVLNLDDLRAFCFGSEPEREFVRVSPFPGVFVEIEYLDPPLAQMGSDNIDALLRQLKPEQRNEIVGAAFGGYYWIGDESALADDVPKRKPAASADSAAPEGPPDTP